MSEARRHGLDVFYPIVPDATWVARIVPLGVLTLQLRIKDVPADDVRRQIDASLAIALRLAVAPLFPDRILHRAAVFRRHVVAARADAGSAGHQTEGADPRHCHVADRGRHPAAPSCASSETSVIPAGGIFTSEHERSDFFCGAAFDADFCALPAAIEAGCCCRDISASARSEVPRRKKKK